MHVTIDSPAERILAIPLDRPNHLFPGHIDEAKALLRKFASQWHPDRNARGGEVMAHVNVLFTEAERLIANGKWPDDPGYFNFVTKDGHKYRMQYKKMRKFELGEVLVGENYITYYIERQYHDLAHRALESMSRFSFLTKEMEKEHRRYLPHVHRAYQTHDDGTIIILKKEKNQHMLQDILDALGDTVEVKHAAWMLSCLYNINCYLKIAGITHNDISPYTLFYNVADHSAHLYGGWWYSGKVGKKPIAVPARTLNLSKDFTTKAVDASLIRLTGREIIGSAELMKAPPELARWLRGLGTDDSIKEYRDWQATLLKVFGPRRFATLQLPTNIYQE